MSRVFLVCATVSCPRVGLVDLEPVPEVACPACLQTFSFMDAEQASELLADVRKLEYAQDRRWAWDVDLKVGPRWRGVSDQLAAYQTLLGGL